MDNACLPNLFLDRASSDVQLKIETSAGEPEAVVPAHSLVLRLASNVFRTMLETTNFKEGQTGIVEMTVKGDMNDAIFFLRYLYTRRLEQVDLNVYVSVLLTAHLYEVDDLVELCVERIIRQLTPLNVCRTYATVRNVATENLLAHCKDLMLDFAFLIFKNTLHLTLEENIMSFLLASDRLNVLEEAQALDALWRWGCARQLLEKDGKSVVQQVKMLLPFVRTNLVEKSSNGSPYYASWKFLKSSAKIGELNLSPENKFMTRQPNIKTKLIRFAELLCLHEEPEKISDISVSCDKIEFSVDQGILKTPASNAYNSLMEFSVDRDILLVGVTLKVTGNEKLRAGKKIHLYVNDTAISEPTSFKAVLVNEYASKNEKDPGPFVTIGSTSMPIFQEKRFYVYDVTIDLHKPVLLKKSEFSKLSISIFPMLKSAVYLTARSFPKIFISNSDLTVQFRSRDEKVAVNKFYYFSFE